MPSDGKVFHSSYHGVSSPQQTSGPRTETRTQMPHLRGAGSRLCPGATQPRAPTGLSRSEGGSSLCPGGLWAAARLWSQKAGPAEFKRGPPSAQEVLRFICRPPIRLPLPPPLLLPPHPAFEAGFLHQERAWLPGTAGNIWEHFWLSHPWGRFWEGLLQTFQQQWHWGKSSPFKGRFFASPSVGVSGGRHGFFSPQTCT